jgi:hypothetical protein
MLFSKEEDMKNGRLSGGLTGCLALIAAAFVMSYPGGVPAQGDSAMQEKLAVIKQAAAANQQTLHQYSWLETTQIALKGEVKSTTQDQCVYRSDGKVQKTPVSQPQQQQQQESGRRRRGRIKEEIVEKKKDEMKDYMQQVKGLIVQYVPPDPKRMQQAFQSGNVSVNPSPGMISLVFKDYVQPGDSMTLAVDENTKKLSSLKVNSYLGEAKDAVTLSVQFALLPDGTSYPAQEVAVAAAKNIQVTVTNSNYQNLAAQ